MRRWMLVIWSVLVLVTACSTVSAPTPEAVAQAWAEGVKNGDTAAVTRLMNVTNDNVLFASFWRRAQNFREAGRLQNYTIRQVTASGNSTDVIIEWTGSQAPVCTRVQIAPDRTVSNVSDFETCPE